MEVKDTRREESNLKTERFEDNPKIHVERRGTDKDSSPWDYLFRCFVSKKIFFN